MHTKKNKPFIQTAVYGAMSLASYIVLFMNEQVITDFFTRGGKFVALPIATAFYFSFLHGAFASNLIRVMGLVEKKH